MSVHLHTVEQAGSDRALAMCSTESHFLARISSGAVPSREPQKSLSPSLRMAVDRVKGKSFVLYRFYSAADTATLIDRLRQLVDDNALWASDPRTFNDPFEFKIVLDLNAETDVRHARYFLDNPKRSEEDFEVWNRSMDRQKWYVEQEARAGVLGTHGIVCLTKRWDHELLWAHYGKHHTGFCVGFDREAMAGWSEHVVMRDVQYLDDAPVFKFFTESPDDFVRKTVFSKSSAWSYEEEVRLLFEGSGLRSLPSGAVKEVTLGCRAPSGLRNLANAYYGAAPFPLYQAAERLDRFRLTRNLIDPKVATMTSHF